MPADQFAAAFTAAVRYAAPKFESELHHKLHELRPELAAAAQKEYDAWDQDFDEYGDLDLGFGGICQNIAEAMGEVLSKHGIDSYTLDNNGVGEQHVWQLAHDDKHAYHVDIEPHHYETGGGYNWKKIPGVQFNHDHVDVVPADRSDFADLLDDGEDDDAND